MTEPARQRDESDPEPLAPPQDEATGFDRVIVLSGRQVGRGARLRREAEEAGAKVIEPGSTLAEAADNGMGC